MALDLKTKTVNKITNGLYEVVFQAFDTNAPATILAEFSVQGRSLAEVTGQIVSKYTAFKHRHDQQAALKALADQAIADAKAIITGG